MKTNVQPLYSAFYEGYVQKLSGKNLFLALEEHVQDFKKLAQFNDKADFAYQSGKWTVKQVVQHALDTERIMAYRLLCIARGEQQSLPGFEENDYAAAADVSGKSMISLSAEFVTLRQANLFLYQSMDTDELLAKTGAANNNKVNVLGLLYIIGGHWEHHKTILNDRYGLSI